MDVFVYGTLTDPDRARSVLGDAVAFGPSATLVGLRRVEGRYPTLAPPAEDGSSGSGGGRPRVEGRIIRTPEIGALDEYEAVDEGLYVRVTVQASGGDRDSGSDVETYVGRPERLGVDDVEWPGSGTFGERVHGYLDRESVHVETDR